VIQCYHTLAQLQTCFDGWDIELIQLGPSRLKGAASSIALPRLRVVRLQAGKSLLIRGTASAHCQSLIVSSTPSQPARWLGRAIDADHFAVAGKGARIDLFVPAEATLSIVELKLPLSVAPKHVQLRVATTAMVEALLSSADFVLDHPTASDLELHQQVHLSLAATALSVPDVTTRSLRGWAVERACQYIDVRLPKPISLGGLSRHCGVGIRTLEYSFRQFYDTTPIAFIKSQRLTRTHFELTRCEARVTSIGKVARAMGFTHMGQYCQDYRVLFGESPSMTLHRALSVHLSASDESHEWSPQ
jgi:AraC-like DNA-binding protein